MPEQILGAVNGCLLTIDKLGEAGKMIEAIKISFFQPTNANYLQLNLTVYLVEPWPSSEKFKAETSRYASELRYSADLLSADNIAEEVFANIVAAIKRQISSHEKNNQKLGAILEDLTPHK